jgi:hypothetical protein
LGKLYMVSLHKGQKEKEILLVVHSKKQRTAIVVARLGRPDIEDRIRQAMANTRLEGRRPSPRSEALLRPVVTGELTYEVALSVIRSWYV